MEQEEQPTREDAEDKNTVSKNIIIVVVIAIVVVVLALMYIWGSSVEVAKDEEMETEPQVFTYEDEQTEDLKQVEESDEIGDIEKDIQETSLDNLDENLADLEAEIDAALAE